MANRAQLRKLAEERVREAQALLNAGLWSGAYYLAGYAVELGLKACVLAVVERTGVIFVDKKFSERCFTHEAEQLVKLADLTAERDAELGSNPAFVTFWGVVKDWKETARYKEWDEIEARKLFLAVTADPNGVLAWIRIYW